MKVVWYRACTDIFLLICYLFLSFPETVIGKPYIGPVPLYFCAFYLAVIFSLIQMWIERLSFSDLSKKTSIAMLFCIFLGVIKGWPFRDIILDTSAFLGLIVGMQWGFLRGKQYIYAAFEKMTSVFLLILFFTVVGMVLGWIASSRVSNRVYVYSAFRLVFFLAMMIVPLSAKVSNVSQGFWTQNVKALSVVCTMLFAAVVMAARSLLIEAMFVGFFLYFLRREQYPGLQFFVVCIFSTFLLISTIFKGGSLSFDLGLLGERLLQNGGGEDRLEEVKMLLSQMSGIDWVIGKGFGSRFHSPVVINGSDLALHPHIAIFAFLLKGGGILFSIFILYPTWIGVRQLFNSKKEKKAWSCNVLLFILMAILSTAWEFFYLFFYGISLQYFCSVLPSLKEKLVVKKSHWSQKKYYR